MSRNANPSTLGILLAQASEDCKRANIALLSMGDKCATCNHCGKQFRITSDSGKAKFCSRACARTAVGRVTMAKNRLVRPVTRLMENKCPSCGKPFKSWAASKRVYCSQACSVEPVLSKGHATKSANGSLINHNTFSTSVKGWRVIGKQRIFARSRWEANYGRYLEMLRANGDIISWEHEPETFWFTRIKRGCRSYKPDFRVTIKSKSPDLISSTEVEYHEVKGWMYPRAKTALKRMGIYHPTVRVILIDQHRYKALAKTCKNIIPGWE